MSNISICSSLPTSRQAMSYILMFSLHPWPERPASPSFLLRSSSSVLLSAVISISSLVQITQACRASPSLRCRSQLHSLACSAYDARFETIVEASIVQLLSHTHTHSTTTTTTRQRTTYTFEGKDQAQREKCSSSPSSSSSHSSASPHSSRHSIPPSSRLHSPPRHQPSKFTPSLLLLHRQIASPLLLAENWTIELSTSRRGMSC